MPQRTPEHAFGYGLRSAPDRGRPPSCCGLDSIAVFGEAKPGTFQDLFEPALRPDRVVVRETV